VWSEWNTRKAGVYAHGWVNEQMVIEKRGTRKKMGELEHVVRRGIRGIGRRRDSSFVLRKRRVWVRGGGLQSRGMGSDPISCRRGEKDSFAITDGKAAESKRHYLIKSRNGKMLKRWKEFGNFSQKKGKG